MAKMMKSKSRAVSASEYEVGIGESDWGSCPNVEMSIHT